MDTPWTDWFEGVLVEHPSFGQGQLVAEPNSRWLHFVPVGSGPFVAIPAAQALAEVRIIPPEEISDELEDLDWESASWSPLADIDQALADGLAALAVARFFASGVLDDQWQIKAMSQLQLHMGQTDKGVRILRFVMPMEAGEYLYEWDGTHTTAQAIARGAGDAAGRTIVVNRAAGSPCGWEAGPAAGTTG